MRRQEAVRKRPLWQPLPLAALETLLRDIERQVDIDADLHATFEAIKLSHEAWRISHYDRPAWLLRQLYALHRHGDAFVSEVAEMLGADTKTLERQSYGVFKFKAAHDAELELVPW